MKSIDHHYASIAYESITKYEHENEQGSMAKRYGMVCHKFPSMVLLNGLRLTVAYFNSASTENQCVYKQYIRDMGIALNKTDLGKEIPEHSTEYRHLSQNALRASVWFKRYAEAILKVKESQE